MNCTEGKARLIERATCHRDLILARGNRADIDRANHWYDRATQTEQPESEWKTLTARLRNLAYQVAGL